MSIREINQAIVAGKHVVVRYTLDGQATQGRIIRARLRYGSTQGKLLSLGIWVTIDLQHVWIA